METTDLTNWKHIQNYVALPPHQYAYGSVAMSCRSHEWLCELRRQAGAHGLRVDIETAGKRSEQVIFIRQEAA